MFFVFQGVMSDSIDWNLLQQQYSSNSLFYDRLANLVTVIDKCKITDSHKSVQTNDSGNIHSSRNV